MDNLINNKLISKVAGKLEPIVSDKATSAIAEVVSYNQVNNTANIKIFGISEETKTVSNVPILYTNQKCIYHAGEQVYVSFVNGDIMLPVVVGKIDLMYAMNEYENLKSKYIDIL